MKRNLRSSKYLSKLFILLIIHLFIQLRAEQFSFSRVPTATLAVDGIEAFEIELTADGNFLYLAGVQGQLAYVNVTVDAEPYVVDLLDLAESINDILLTSDEKILVIAVGDDGLLLLDLTNPSNLTECPKTFHSKDNFKTLTIQFLKYEDNEQILFISKRGGFEIIDTTNYVTNQFTILTNQLLNPNDEVGRIAITLDKRFAFVPVFIGITGYYIYDIQNLGNIVQVSFGNNPDNNGINRIVMHPTRKLAFILQMRDTIFCIDYTILYTATTPQNELAKVGEWEDEARSQKSDMIITKDGNIVIVTAKSYGLFILNVANPANIIMQQRQYIGSFISQISFDVTETYIYYTNIITLGIIQIAEQNFNLDIPNLFTGRQSLSWENTGIEQWPMGIEFNYDQSQLWVAYGSDGIRVFNSTNLPELTLLKTYTATDFPFITGNPPYISTLEFHPIDTNVLFFAIKGKGFMAVNFIDINNPDIKSEIEVQGDHDDFEFFDSGKKFALASGPQGILFYNIESYTNIYQISQAQYIYYVYYVLINKEENLAIGSYRDFGIVIFDISDIAVPKNISLIYTGGGEDMKFLKRAPNILILGDNVMGSKIISLQNPAKPFVLSSIDYPGNTFHIEISPDENYFYGAATDGAQINCINIKNLRKPKLAQTFDNGERGIATTITKNGEYILVTSFIGVRVIPLSTPIRINTEIFEFDSKLQKYYKKNINEEPLYVGEEIYIFFTIIGSPFSQVIQSAQQYDEGTLSNLPSWVKFDSNSDTIIINVNKDGLGDYMIVTINKIKIIPSDFAAITGNNTVSLQILDELMDKGYIDGDQYVSDSFDQSETIFFQDSTLQQYSALVEQVLLNKVFLVPSLLPIQTSLIFSPESEQQSVSTLNRQVSVQFTVVIGVGQFVKQSFLGVVAEFNDELTSLTITGAVSSVNEQLQRVRYSRQQPLNESKCEVLIDDTINIPIYQVFTIDQFNFMKQNHLVNVAFPIQKQLEDAYGGWSIYIEEPFEFKIMITTFYDEDPLTYKAFYISDSKEIPVEKTEWLEFVADELTFKGLPLQKYYGNVYEFVVYATDGYSTTSDRFKFKTSSLPIMYMINWILTLLGPLISVIGAIKYRIQIYHILCKRKYTYGTIHLKAHDQFERIFPLIFDEKNLAQELWDQFYKVHKSDFLKKFVDKELNLQQDMYIASVLKTNPGLKAELQELLQNNTGYLHKMLIVKAVFHILNGDSMHSKIYNKLKNLAIRQLTQYQTEKEWYLYYVDIDYTFIPKVLFPQIKVKFDTFIQ